MANQLQTLENWLLGTPTIPNVYPTVAVTLFTWAEGENSEDYPPKYAYYGWMIKPGFSVIATLNSPNVQPYFFYAAHILASGGVCEFQGTILQRPDYPEAGGQAQTTGNVVTSDDGEMVQLDWEVGFSWEGQASFVQCSLLLQQSGQFIVRPHVVPPIKAAPIDR